MKEIDIIIEKDGALYPIEIKKTALPSKTANKTFSVLEKLGKKSGHGIVLCLIESPIPLSRDVTAVPIGMI